MTFIQLTILLATSKKRLRHQGTGQDASFSLDEGDAGLIGTNVPQINPAGKK